MTRAWGRAPKGQRINEATPQGRWKVLTTLGAMSLRGMEAVMTVQSATDGEVFLTYLEQVLCPKLGCGEVVIMDNLSAHKVEGIRELIEGCGARLIYLPPYSPDLNPIEKAWFKFKQFLEAPRRELNKPSTSPSPRRSKPSPAKTPPHGSAIAATGYSNRSFALMGSQNAIGNWKCQET